MPMADTIDVIIVGAGVIGLSIAYHLADKNKNLRITLLEKEKFHGAGSTAQCTGGIRHQFTNPLNIKLTKMSYPHFVSFAGSMKYPIYFRKKGYLFVTTRESHWQTLLKIKEQLTNEEIPMDLLTPENIKERHPLIETCDLLGGGYCPWDAYADPYGVMEGYYKQCRRLGVEVLVNRPVEAVITKAGRAAGVHTKEGDLYAPVVINAAGPHLHLVAHTAGVDLPAAPYRRQVYVCAPMPGVPAHTPLIVDLDTGFYLHVEKNGILLLGGTDRDTSPGLEPVVERSRMWPFIEAAMTRIPLLEEARITGIYTGIRSLTSDGLGILGETSVRGFYCVGGFGGSGFMHAPALGMITSDLIVGETPALDIAPLSPLRFIRSQRQEEALF